MLKQPITWFNQSIPSSSTDTTQIQNSAPKLDTSSKAAAHFIINDLNDMYGNEGGVDFMRSKDSSVPPLIEDKSLVR